MLCRELTIVKHAEAGLQVSTLWCNSWQCPVCCGRRAWRCAQDMEAGFPRKFLTLTVQSKRGLSKEMRARELLDAFRAWVRHVRYRFGKTKCEYYYVFEDTEAGEPHLHVVGRWPYIDKKEISEFFGKRIAAPNTRIDGVKSAKGLSSYLTAYLTKGPTKFGDLKRYGYSRRYRVKPRTKPHQDPSWRGYCDKVERPWGELVAEYIMRGYRMMDDAKRGWCRLQRPQPPPAPSPVPQASVWTDASTRLYRP